MNADRPARDRPKRTGTKAPWKGDHEDKNSLPELHSAVGEHGCILWTTPCDGNRLHMILRDWDTEQESQSCR